MCFVRSTALQPVEEMRRARTGGRIVPTVKFRFLYCGITLTLVSLEELIKACAKDGNAREWEEFVQRFHAVIAAIITRTAQRWGSNSVALVDDLIQDTYLKLCSEQRRLLSEFRPEHPEAFYGYLKVIATNVVRDHFRAQRSQKRWSGQPETAIDETVTECPVEGGRVDDVHRNILLQEVDRALRGALDQENASRDLTIFWLHYRAGLSAAAIARLPSISLTVKGVEGVVHRLTCLLRERFAQKDEP